jgi:regulator of protease activity HflC (stomatin/prohibitin superfamily)
MIGFRYIKSSPTEYLIQFQNGRVVREGVGLSFWYFAPNTVLVRVPMSTVDVPFVFNEVSADFQTLTLQGQLSYRITNPRQIAGRLDFSISPSGRYLSEDPSKLNDRLVAQTQVLASAISHRMTLREALGAHETLMKEILAGLRASELATLLGLEIVNVSILSISPSPETAKALEAETREQLMRKADEALYARRNAAVEQERLIKESELNTEIAVEEKKRQIRETQLAADIAVEEQRQALLAKKVENDRKEADAKAYAIDAMMKPIRDVDWRTLSAISAGRSDARLNIAIAFRELAEHAEKIGTLNITPELLDGLLSSQPATTQPPPQRK